MAVCTDLAYLCPRRPTLPLFTNRPDGPRGQRRKANSCQDCNASAAFAHPTDLRPLSSVIYSALMPPCLTTFSHFLISLTMNPPKSPPFLHPVLPPSFPTPFSTSAACC